MSIMLSKKQLSNIGSFIREYLNTPTKVGMFLSMILWGFSIRLLLIFLPIEKTVRYVIPDSRQTSFSTLDILTYLNWLKKLRVIKQRGECLAQSLVYYRFLYITGEKPEIVIGFKDVIGHAWVEIFGEVISEAPDKIKDFTPVLILHTGNTEFVSIH